VKATSYDTLNVTGTATNSGTVTVATALGGAGTLTNAATGILNIGGTSAITTLNASTAGNVVNYTGGGAQTINPTTYATLNFSGAGVKTNSGIVTVNTALTGTALTNAASGQLHVNFTGAMGITTLTATAVGNLVDYGFAGAQTVRATAYSNLGLSGSGIKTLTGVTTVGGNLTLSGTATATTAAALAIGGNLNVGVGTTLTVGAFNIGVTGTTSVSGTLAHSSNVGTTTYTGAVTINSGGSLTNAGNAAITYAGGLVNNESFASGTGAQTFTNGGITHNGTAFTAGTGAFVFSTNPQAINCASALTIPNITVTTIAVTNNCNLTVTTALAGTGNLTNSAAGTLNLGGTSLITTLTATAAGNTVNYTGAAQTVKATAYSNLGLGGSGVKTLTGVTTVGSNLTMSGTATAAAAAALTVGGNFSIGATNTFANGTFALNVAGNFAQDGTFTAGTGVVTLNGGAAVQTISGAGTLGFANLTVNNTGGITLARNVTVTSAIIGAVTLTSTCPTDYTLTSNGGVTVQHSCPPTSVVNSINCSVSCAATSAATVSWTVTFNKSVAGVDATAFSLAASGVSGAYITAVTGGGTTWTVTANTGIGSGTLGLNQTGPGSVVPTLSGTFTGQVYTISATPALAEYRMDEASWNGTVGEVVDSSGSGNHAQSFNSASTDAATPAIATNPGTCRYGVFDNGTTITQGYVQTPLPDLTTDFTVTAWISTTNNTVAAQRILIDDQNNSGGYGISLGDGAAGILRFYSRGITPVILDSTYTIANNTWYFVAAVADITNRIRTIYVYSAAGTLLASTSDAAAFTGIWGTDAGPVSIGGEVNGPPQTEPPATFHFRGNIDEVRVYQKVLSQNALAAIALQTHVCPVIGPDHILVQDDGNGLTCTPEILTVIACANAACTTPNYTASAVTGVITWAGTPGGTIPFNIIANGTTTASLPVTTVQTVTLGTSAVNPAAANPSTCWNTATSTASCTMTFNDSGLLVSVPNHVSETLQNITISAVRKSNNALNCVPAFANVSRAVNLKCVYSNPTTGTLPLRVAGTPLAANATSACSAGGATPTLAFDATGTATPTLQYADVGQMTLNGTYTGSAGTGDSGLSMTGSGSFIAAPASFAFSGITAPPIKAGNSFNATVTALNSLGAATPNFGKETSPEGVTLTQTLVQPTGGGASAGALTAPSFTAYTGGATTATTSWSEVGLITLTATNSNYLSSGLTATGTSANIGPFIPDHFNTIVTQGCSVGLYTYSGQPFGVQVKAMNGAVTPAVTQNYDGTVNTSPNFANAVTLSDASGAPGTLAPPTVASTAFNAGVAPVTAAFTFTSRTTAATPISMRAVYTNAAPAYTVTSSGFTEGSTTIRSGRARFNNAHGSEILALPVPFHTEYWNNGWVINTADSCTGDASLVLANAVSVTLSALPATCVQDNGNPGLSGAGCAAVGPVAQRFTKGPSIGFAGNFNLWLKAPGAGNTGAVTVTGNVPTWLQYPWGGGAAINPTARATFGVYKGANEFIYLRENY
jgi:MSHA biogenesis protein MshQ